MEDPGFSIWFLLILTALLFVVLWGFLFVFLAFGTWFIARSRMPTEEPRPNRDSTWVMPPPPPSPPGTPPKGDG